jgi:hypothetical protein
MNVVFNCGDYFQDFCSYQAKVEVLRVCFFLFLIFAPCPIRCFTIPLDRGNGVYLGRGLISLFFLLHFRFENDTLHSNFKLYVYPNVYANYTLLVSH